MKKKTDQSKEEPAASIPSEEPMANIPPKAPRPEPGQAPAPVKRPAQTAANASGVPEAGKTCPAPPDDPTKELAKLQNEILQLRKAAKERDELKNLAQRVQADFENYQKRIKRDKECWEKYKDETLLKELIPAFDNLDRALKTECKSDDARCLLDGVGLSKQEIFRILDKHGIKQIKITDQKFDPKYHEVVSAIESIEKPDGAIIEETARGFMLYDRVIRPAKVIIAVNKKKTPEPKDAVEPPAAPTC